jgi:hypothetical protein
MESIEKIGTEHKKKRNLWSGSKNDHFMEPRKNIKASSKIILVGGVLESVAA